jgi:hypothetical protein
MRILNRALAAITLAALALATTASAAADKPLVMESGKVKQLPSSTTIQLNASGTGAAPINIPHGTAPTSPNNGDCWTTTGGLFCRINGSTVGPYGTGSGSGSVSTTGSPALGNLSKFSGATSITNGDLAGDVTTSGTLTTTIANDAVTYAKIQNVSAASKLLGRGDSGSGDPQEITIGSGLTMTGTTLSSSGGGSALTVKDEGSTLSAAVTSIDFVGNGVVATNTGGAVTVTIAGQNVVAPVYRSSNIQQSSSGSYTVSWPSGTAAGDRVFIFGGHGFALNSPAGWVVLDNQSGANWNGAAWTRVLTSADITAGSVTITTGGGFNGVLVCVAMNGAPEVRLPEVSERSGSGVSSDTFGSDGSPRNGDMALLFASNRAASTDSIDLGTQRAVINNTVSGVFNTYPITADGGIVATATYSTGGSGYYEAVVILRGS